jgi:hypothetical protein
MDGLFLACLMGICGMPMSPSAEPLMPLSLATPAAQSAATPTSPPPSVADVAATVSIAAPAPTVEQPVERPVPTSSDGEPPPAAAPDGVTAASTSKSSRAAIGDVVRRHTPAIRHCYETGLGDDPTFAGTIEASWRIQVDGRVQTVTIVGGTKRSAVVERCLLAEIARWEFPPTAEPSVVGTYPFVFDTSLLARHAPAAASNGKAVPASPSRRP